MMFRSHRNTSEFFLRASVTIATFANSMLFSCGRYPVYVQKLTLYFTGVHIIKWFSFMNALK